MKRYSTPLELYTTLIRLNSVVKRGGTKFTKDQENFHMITGGKTMIVNVFDERAPGKHGVAPLEKGKDVVVVKITKNMTMGQVSSKIKDEVEAAGGGPGSISLIRFFGHGNAGTMDFGKGFRYWMVEPLKDLAPYIDPEGKGLELHGCYTASAVHVPGQDCTKPGAFYPKTHAPGKVGLGFELLLALSQTLKVAVTGGISCQYGDNAHKLEGPTITVSPDGITMRNVPIDKYDDRGKPPDSKEQPESQIDVKDSSVMHDLSDRIEILDFDLDGPTPFLQQSQSSAPDISDRIEILDFDLDEQDSFGVRDRQDRLPDISDRIEILDFDLDEQDNVDFREPFNPLFSQNPLETAGIDQLSDLIEDRDFDSFADQDPLVRPVANRLTDFMEDRDFDSFADQSPTVRPVANRLTDFMEDRDFDSFADQDPLVRPVANRLTDFMEDRDFDSFADINPSRQFGGGQTGFQGDRKPFQPFAETPNWMKNAFSEPPQSRSLMNNQPFAETPNWMKNAFSEPPQSRSLMNNQPFADKPHWKK
jgi:hypothetical protein